MAGHKKQHFVPRSYLKAWCDPSAAAHHEPYVWTVSKDGSSVRRRAPGNIFHETDLYTIHLADGQRDLVIEHGLAQLESEFVSLRDTYFAHSRHVKPSRFLWVAAFVAAMQQRTPQYAQHVAGQWQQALDLADRMSDWAKTATDEEKRALSSIPRDPSQEIPIEHVRAIVDAPLQTMLVPGVTAATPLLAALDWIVLSAPEGDEFITSDNPCVWFDAEARHRSFPHRAPALMYDTIEITMPISPRQLILLNRKGLRGYLPIDSEMVCEFNRRTRFYSHEHIVCSTGAANPLWFQ